jgi:methionyl-tRNA formyltransferase
MRIAFLGTPAFAVPTLDALVAAGHDVALVVSQPDKPAGRGQALTKPPVAARALELGLPLAQPKALKSGPFPERWAALGLDAAVVVAYGRILPEALLRAPRLGCVNVHASLLPRWRGAAPIQWAVLAGDAETGVCTQRMEPELDTGPLWVERRTPLSPRETAGSLHDRLMGLAAEAAVETLRVAEGSEPRAQATDGVTWAHKLEKDDGRVGPILPSSVQPMASGIWEKPRYMAFLSSGAKLPMNSLNLGLESISPTEKTRMAPTETQPAMEYPDRTMATVARSVPTTMLVVAASGPTARRRGSR